jgi:hypothetical protein
MTPTVRPSFTPPEAIRDPLDPYRDPTTEIGVRLVIADKLHGEVAAMNLDNFVVRPKRRWVEK